ncbi:L-2-amino-thiazoline-4-carboxylic acid hydrolase [Bacillus sp. H-16]|uniref:L-2-amino-thiazoline-4-carboxylic acid hydrolase n=1 Tax=Alteribacter salitolerans TaxID=2912333 RepID=UPI00196500D3|nr:L-2-amino-thiazoline-4-carboxylic acid hydrolase [Alteribacter salitolerans]MBM7097592.1 L-2-amino-thiazoline-4-carboxylic acid hydrolase [Alteribacter salitolerans]
MNIESKPLPALSMYRITARLFTHVEASVSAAFGETGKELIQKGVNRFGCDLAQNISLRASDEGERHVLSNYIPTHVDKKKLDQNEADIYSQMAGLFGQTAKSVVDEYGGRGKDAVREGVRTFGEARGKGIAERAAHLGQDNTIENYLSNYDMGRSELFEMETHHYPEVIQQTFTACPFGKQWADDNMGEYGILYCEMIDPSIAKGYNKDFEVDHDQYVLKEGVCEFKFKLKK